MNKVIVVAGNQEQFDNFLSDVYPDDRGNFVYADTRNIMAIEASQIIRVGTFWERADLYELCMLAESRIRR